MLLETSYKLKMDIITVGYCGTGSSAIEDILLEYRNFTVGDYGRYEHVLFYIPDGLFDLEDRILYNNSIHMFDGAITRFYAAMKRLNDCDFGWFGGYKNRTGERFMTIVNQFIEALTQYKIEGSWSDNLSTKKTIKGMIKDKVLSSGAERKKGGERPYLKKDDDGIVRYSFISREEFYQKAKIFVREYCEMIKEGHESESFIFDQLLLPQHLNRFENYFDTEKIKVIVVDRDPRDMFVLSKYVWPYIHKRDKKEFPVDVEEFIGFYRAMRIGVDYSKEYILLVQFEDLVYKYPQMTEIIENYLQIGATDHVRIQTIFVPDKSINNTQNFLIYDSWNEETHVIADLLKEYCYDFPYRIHVNIKDTSDT